MHRGSIFIIIKDNTNKFQVEKSTEFNGGMGIENFGGAVYEMLRKLKEPLLFDAIIRDFDSRYFKYFDDIMTYTLDEQKTPYIDKNGYEIFEYSQNGKQFKFFKDDNGEYIYTSDSNYIKNMTDEDISIVCCNGNYVLKPEQILIADYDECINNTRISFGEKIRPNVIVDHLDTTKYIATKKENLILENIIKAIEEFNFNVKLLSENGMINGMEIETWTEGGVDMIHTIYFFDDYQKIYDKDNVNKAIDELYENFSIDEEIDLYRQDKRYKNDFTIRESLEDFEKYHNRLKDLSKNFLSKYHELIYKKFINNELGKEVENYEINN